MSPTSNHFGQSALLILSLALGTKTLASPQTARCLDKSWQTEAMSAVFQANVPPTDAYFSLKAACEELQRGLKEPLYRKSSWTEKRLESLGHFVSFPKAPAAASKQKSAFSAAEKELVQSIEQSMKGILKIQEPIERIKGAYEATKYIVNDARLNMAVLDSIVDAKPLVLVSPSEGVKGSVEPRSAHSPGRSYSAVLYALLTKIAKESKVKMKPELRIASLPFGKTLGDYSWVRLTMEPLGAAAITYDLDPLTYRSFTPLVPRKTGIDRPHIERLSLPCSETLQCLLSLGR